MPGDTKSHKARIAKKAIRIRKLGDLTDTRRELWRAIVVARGVLTNADNPPELTLKAVHAITQASTAYVKLIEVGELEARLAELEKAVEANKTTSILRHAV